MNNNNNPTYQLPLAIENIDFTNLRDTSTLFLQLMNLQVRIHEQAQSEDHLCTACLKMHTYQTLHRNCTVCRNTEHQTALTHLIIKWIFENRFPTNHS